MHTLHSHESQLLLFQFVSCTWHRAAAVRGDLTESPLALDPLFASSWHTGAVTECHTNARGGCGAVVVVVGAQVSAHCQAPGRSHHGIERRRPKPPERRLPKTIAVFSMERAPEGAARRHGRGRAGRGRGRATLGPRALVDESRHLLRDVARLLRERLLAGHHHLLARLHPLHEQLLRGARKRRRVRVVGARERCPRARLCEQLREHLGHGVRGGAALLFVLARERRPSRRPLAPPPAAGRICCGSAPFEFDAATG